MEEKQQLTGLGKLYVTTADDKNLERLMEIDCEATHLHTLDLEDGGWEEDKKGFTFTGTATIEADEQSRKFFKRLAQGDGRLPRKEKKRRIGRVMRNKDMFVPLLIQTLYDMNEAQQMATAMLFPDRVRKTPENGQLAVYVNPAQLHLATNFTKRLYRHRTKWLRKEWNRDRTPFKKFMEFAEQVTQTL